MRATSRSPPRTGELRAKDARRLPLTGDTVSVPVPYRPFRDHFTAPPLVARLPKGGPCMSLKSGVDNPPQPAAPLPGSRTVRRSQAAARVLPLPAPRRPRPDAPFSDHQGRTLFSGVTRPGRVHDQTAVRTEGIAEQFRLRPNVKAEVDEGYRGLANEFPHQVSAPPRKPKDDVCDGERRAWREQRRRQSSARICVEHTNAEYKQ
ncbi:transposase family protein [Streptomyces sp. NPDC088178]|uniref:transposase family protein n=1 Tax=Streptomyces sp. NPDC088178 TaxID=3365836 RepID=UPI0037F48862